VQFHPEFQSKPNAPHPLFAAFIGASLKNSRGGNKVKKAGKTVAKPRKTVKKK
jgi:CTP synthase